MTTDKMTDRAVDLVGTQDASGVQPQTKGTFVLERCPLHDDVRQIIEDMQVPLYYHSKITHLRNVFKISKHTARLSAPPTYFSVYARISLACITTSATIHNDYARVLTSVQRLAEHFCIPQEQVYYDLSLLQNACFEGIPIIICRRYDTLAARASVGSQLGNYVSRKRLDVLRSKEKIRKASIKRTLGYNETERPLEIIIPAYQYLTFDIDREGDFYFFFNNLWRPDDLDMRERMYLSLIRSYTKSNKKRGYSEVCYLPIRMYCDIFKTSHALVHRVLRSLGQKGYILWKHNNVSSRVDVTEKTIESMKTEVEVCRQANP